MAAVTETLRRDLIMGNMRGVKAHLADVDATDTWDPGLSIVEFFTFLPQTSAAGSQWGATITQGTAGGANQARITFNVEGSDDTLEGEGIAWGC